MIRNKVLPILLALLLLAGQSLAAPTHTVTAFLTYDFTVDNACSTTVTTGCLQQFNVYDISPVVGSVPVKLFSIPAPAGSNTAGVSITGTSGAVTLKAGNHTFGFTAQMADGTEGNPNGSTATGVVAPVPPTCRTTGPCVVIN